MNILINKQLRVSSFEKVRLLLEIGEYVTRLFLNCWNGEQNVMT